MSSSSSLTPEEVVNAAKLNKDLLDPYLVVHSDAVRTIQQQEEKLEDLQGQLEELRDQGVEYLDEVNRDQKAVETVKAAIDPVIKHLREEHKAEVRLYNLEDKFLTYIEQNKEDEPFLVTLANQYQWYKQGHLQNILSPTFIALNKADRVSLAIGNAMAAALIEAIDPILDTPRKLKVARDHYKKFIVEYLLHKFKQADKTGIARSSDYYEKVLSPVINRLYEPGYGGTTPFIDDLMNVVFTEEEIKELNVEIKALSDLEKILAAKFITMNQFENAMVQFHHGLIKQGKPTELFGYLPVLERFLQFGTSPREAPPTFEMWQAEKGNRNFFPTASEADQIKLEKILKDFHRELKAQPKPETKERPLEHQMIINAASEITANRFAMREGSIIPAFDIYVDFFRYMKNIKDVLMEVRSAFTPVTLFSPTHPGEQKYSANAATKTEQNTITSTMHQFLQLLFDYSGDAKCSQEFRDKVIALEAEVQGVSEETEERTLSVSEQPETKEAVTITETFHQQSLHVPTILEKHVKSMKAIEEFESLIANYQRLAAQEERVKAQLGVLRNNAKDLDSPMLALLRAQLLHAAKIYFHPEKKPNVLTHALHHGKDSEENLVKLIQNVMSPKIKSFREAVNIIIDCINKNKVGKGLSTNSLDSILAFVLYNEGTPRGLFRTKLEEIVAEQKTENRLEQHYPGYNLETARKQTAVSALKEYLEKTYKLPRLELKGQVTHSVRGKARVEEEYRGQVRAEMLKNLTTMADLIDQAKKGQAPEYKVEKPATRVTNQPGAGKRK